MSQILRLVLEAADGADRQFLLAGNDAIVGRAEQGDIVIPHDTVSGRHGMFRAKTVGYTYTDLGSRNGSAIERERSGVIALPAGEELAIEPGDVILLGSAERPARLRVEEGRAPLEPVRSIERTLVATSALADLLTESPTQMVGLAAQCIAADTPERLADAALEFLRATIQPAVGHAVVLHGGGFSVTVGDVIPDDLLAESNLRRDVACFEGAGFGAAVLAPLVARDAWHGTLAAWTREGDPKSLTRAVIQPLDVAAPLVALSVSTLVVRTEQAEALRALEADRADDSAPLGTAPAFAAALDLARRLATADVAILLSGETGCGKEVFARSIHDHSARRDGPFVAVNCGAIPPSLLEAELFGHVEGAFTGAGSGRAGVFEQAHGGTLFLDELGEMPLAMQAGILRALENGEIRRVGDTKVRHVDVRLVSATHRDLAEMVEAKTFRADLMYRLDAAKIRIPPLRERGDDILQLAHAFVAEEARRARKRIRGFAPEALLLLDAYPFPGNVRELKNEVARAVALTPDGSLVVPTAFSDKLRPNAAANEARADNERTRTLKESVALAELHAVELAITRADGNLSQAARDLGLTRPGLYKVLVRLGLRS
ncbi:MAG: sigma 54-interacting transcriptional regulator [Deltaproteobacteria bacterium]